MCGGDSCGGYETKSWMGQASTALSAAVRLAEKNDAALPMPTPVPCMLGEVERPNGYWVTRTCRVNVSVAVSQSTRLQIDLILAPQNGMTGCWSEACGKLAFAWLLNTLTLQLPSSPLPPCARASLAAADVFRRCSPPRQCGSGPGSDRSMTTMATAYACAWHAHMHAHAHGNHVRDRELDGAEPNISQSCVGKHGVQLRWRVYTDGGVCTLTATRPRRHIYRLQHFSQNGA